jgi:hypothetical protein
MPETQTMSLHEKLAIVVKNVELKKQGKFEEARKPRRTIPMPPFILSAFPAEPGSATPCVLPALT